MAFSEDDRSLFLSICGIRPLSECVRTQPQTENLRPSPAAQDTVRLLLPYIQRFLRHHDELAHVYKELLESNIGETLRRLSFIQVSSARECFEILLVSSQLLSSFLRAERFQ